MERLQAEVQHKGFNIIAKVDRARAGQQAGFNLKPIQLLIFGKPKIGSILIQIDPTVAIDLPMKLFGLEG